MRLIILFTMVLGLPCFAQGPLTADKLKELLQESENYHDKRSREIKANEMDKLVPKSDNKQKRLPDSAKPSPNTSDHTSAAPVVGGGFNDGEKPTPVRKVSGTSHTGKANSIGNESSLPPSWRGKGVQSQMNHRAITSTRKRVVFGIQIGSVFRVKLADRASSGDPDYVKIVVMDDVLGKHRTLPSGTEIFCNKTFNPATSRLDLTPVKLITPDGFEFEGLSGHVRDRNKVAGLTGVVSSDKKTVARSVNAGSHALLSSAANSIGGGNIASDAIAAGATNAIEESRNSSDRKLGDQQFVISTSPQVGFLYVSETF